MLITLYVAALWTCLQAETKIDACVVYNKRGKKATSFLPKVIPIFNDYMQLNGNIIGTSKVKVVWHQADMMSDADRIYEMGPKLINGTWNDDYWSTINTEPPMAPCDVVFVNSDSGSMVHFLNGIKDSGKRIPVYSSGASSDSLWKSSTGSGVYDFVKTANGPGFKQLSLTNIVRLHAMGAKTIVLLWADTLRHNLWAKGVREYTINLIRELGMTVLAQGEVYWDRCAIKENPEACKQKTFASIDKVLIAGGIKFGEKRIQADIYFGLHPHSFGCAEEAEYLFRRQVNFGALLMHLCYAYDPPKGDDIPNYLYDFTYSGMGGHQNVVSQRYDEGIYALTGDPAMFKHLGQKSAMGFYEKMIAKYGTGFWHYQYFWSFASIYMMMKDFNTAGGDLSKMLDSFGIKTSPIVSYYGYLSSDEGGSNPYHDFIGAQLVPTEDGESRSVRIVAPQSIASQDPVYPMPRWDQRGCWPDCAICPKCEELSNNMVSIMITVTAIGMTPLLYGIFVYYGLKRTFAFSLFLSYVLSVPLFMCNCASDVIAIYIVFLQVDAYATTWEEIGIYVVLYVLLTGLSFGFTFLRCSIEFSIMLDIADGNENRYQKAFAVDELVILYGAMLVDLPIMGVQAVMWYTLGGNYALLFSMIATAFTVGVGSQAYSKAVYASNKAGLGIQETRILLRKTMCCHRAGDGLKKKKIDIGRAEVQDE